MSFECRRELCISYYKGKISRGWRKSVCIISLTSASKRMIHLVRKARLWKEACVLIAVMFRCLGITSTKAWGSVFGEIPVPWRRGFISQALETVQPIKSFLSKHEDLNFMPQNPHVKVCMCLQPQCCRGRVEADWPARLNLWDSDH